MTDFVAALGLALMLEGVGYALFAGPIKRALARLQEAPDEALRLLGLLVALVGLFLIWSSRG